ncbi:MAG: ABC transporter ATP-binding protein [Acutalibacteraceae bacterium]|nr:ABC transporter ATP-binding protein [Acutalibacteraceae bacterium]
MKRWLEYVKPYWIYFVLGPLGMIVEVVGEVVLPKFLSAIIDNGVGTKESVGNGSQYIIFITIAMIVTAVLMLLGGVCGAYFGAKASVNFAADLRSDVYRKIQKFSFSNIDKFSTGSLVTRLTNDVTQLQNFVNMLLRMCLRSPGMLIGALVMAITLNAKLAIILAIAMPIIITVQFLIIRKGFPRFNRMQSKIDGLNSTIQENLVNVRVVKSFVREDFEKDKFRESNGNLKKAGISAMNLMIFMQPVMMLLMYATTLVVLWFGGNQVIDFIQNGTGMTVGDLTQFLTYINQILMSLMMITMLFMMWSRAMASGKRIAEVLDEKPDIDDETAAFSEKSVNSGDIEFKNVSFRYYKTSEEKVLNNINIKINSGETVGIIGSTGCGKTTLVSMIPRLYDVDEGSVLVDGVDVKDYSIEKLRDGVSMVLQKNVLFSGTIEDNLKWGNQNASIEEIKKCADCAQADGFIESFTEGYQTELGQGGVNVSGGQKQRICIARAMLKQPKIIIFDDSTSAVDTATEAKIRKSFKNELKDTTKIIIAQRISSVEEADKIIVMDNGVITGIGTHDELLKSNEEYREIYNSQTAKEAN